MFNAAFYLKYRPQSLEELIGQEVVKKTLLSAFSENKLSHAYLLVGPRGTGKTSTARILAKMVNCAAKENIPCNKCEICLSTTDGSNLDLIEIDAASNRGIEDIRALREKIKLSPTSSKKKVYIIDEVHMLTQEAFNALLKTLEEPPSHALFILATTEVNKLPQTILSRVQRLNFSLASDKELLQALQNIVDLEKINIEKEALNFLVRKSGGSFRDGVKLLDQVSSFGEKITLELLEKSLKATKSEIVLDLIKYLSQKDTNSALSLILKQTEEGADSKELILSLMDILRKLVLIKNGVGYESDGLEKLAGDFTNEELIKILEQLQKAYQSLKIASIPSLPLELVVVEICGGPNPEVKRVAVKEDIIGSSDDIEKLKEKWSYVCETIRPFNFSLEALLRSINIKECINSNVILEVPYSFHQRILEAPKNRDLLESILSDILGRNMRVSTVLGARTQRAEDIANIEVAADDEIIRAAAEIFNSDSIN